jgi:hypothetical protein
MESFGLWVGLVFWAGKVLLLSRQGRIVICLAVLFYNEWLLATHLEEFYLWMQQVFRLAIAAMKILRST